MTTWQDMLCPHCHRTDGKHESECSFVEKLKRYEARKAAGESPIIPEGIETVCTMDEVIGVLNKVTGERSENS